MMINNDSLWYKDGVIYQVHIKAFRDSTGDGIGDFGGLLQKLDYLENLGVNIIWILPFYPSPLKDDGYDIADYFNVHPDYGVMDDVKEFIKEAHRRGLKVITELVLNHTSDQHPWFKRARTSPPGSNERNFYVWSDTPEKYKDARIIFQDFEPSNWSWDHVAKSYYWHRFYAHQPDLNFENPAVHKQLLKTIDFWMDAGVDGMRLDAVPYLFEQEGTNCENLPATHDYLKKLNAHVQSKYKNRMLLAEANQWPEDAVVYFGNGDECQMAFHFPLMPRLYMSIQMEDRHPIVDILEQTPDIPENCQWAMFLRNHDELTLEMVTDEERDYMYRYYAKDTRARINLGIRRRLAPLVDNNRRKIELLNILLFSFPGTPVIYYGDEIGMGDNFYLGDRNGVRTPMQWSPDRNAGFSEANPQKLFLPVIIDPEYHYEAINVEVQQRNSSSLLWWMKRTIAVRRNYKSFGRGKLEFLSPSNPKVLAFFRKLEDETVLVVANLSRFSQVVELDLSKYTGYTPIELYSRNKFPVIKEAHYMLTLNAFDYYWFILKNQDTKLKSGEQRIIPELDMNSELKKIMNEPELVFIEETVIPNYIQFHGWKSEDSKIQSVSLLDEIILPGLKRYEALLIIKINYIDQEPEVFLLPVYLAKDDEAKKILNENSNSVLAKIITGHRESVIAEGVYDEEFRKTFLNTIASKRSIKGHNGVMSATFAKGIRDLIDDSSDAASHLIKAGKINIRFSYYDKINLTLYRKVEESINPGVDVLKILSEKTIFKNTPPYAGTITYKTPDTNVFSLGVFTEYIQNQGDLWNYMVDSVIKFFDNISVLGKTNKDFPFIDNLFNVSLPADETSVFYDIIGRNYFEMISLLGKRTAEMHLALNSLANEPGFETEYFSMLYQRSVYQTVRNTSKSTLRMLNKNLGNIPEGILDDVNEIISYGDQIISFASPLLENKIITKKIRVHGDFNLKNVLYTGKDFLIINFEGSENSPYSERRLKRSALRDTASMIWSLSFAAYVALNRNKTTRPEDLPLLEPYAKQWWLYMSGVFLKSYLNCTSGMELMPEDKSEREFLLKVYLTENALRDISIRIQSGTEYLYVPVKGLKNIIEM